MEKNKHSGSVATVEGAVLDCFGEVRDLDGLCGLEVGDGARDFEDAVMGAGTHSLLEHGALEKALGIRAEFAVGADLARGHLRVGVDFFSGFFEAIALTIARGLDAVANLRRTFGCCPAAEFFVLNSGNFDVNVDAVEEWAGDFCDVALNHRRGAYAVVRFVVEVAAGAGIHCGGQHEARGKTQRHGGACDGDGVIFKWLAKDFENIAGKLGELIEKEKTVVGHGDFAGAGNDAAADEARVRDGVMR